MKVEEEARGLLLSLSDEALTVCVGFFKTAGLGFDGGGNGLTNLLDT